MTVIELLEEKAKELARQDGPHGPVTVVHLHSAASLLSADLRRDLEILIVRLRNEGRGPAPAPETVCEATLDQPPVSDSSAATPEPKPDAAKAGLQPQLVAPAPNAPPPAAAESPVSDPAAATVSLAPTAPAPVAPITAPQAVPVTDAAAALVPQVQA